MKITFLLLIVLNLNIFEAAHIIDGGAGRIIGGSPVPLGQIPYFAFVVGSAPNGMFVECGGSLIVYNWVLTAAHCLVPPVNQVQVQLGFVNRNIQAQWSSGALSSDRYFLNPGFSIGNFNNDIGLINIPTTAAILLNPYIGLIQLPLESDGFLNLEGRTATVSGFGEDQTGMPSDVLNSIDLTIVANSQCQANFPPAFFGSSHLCTGNSGQQGATIGDGGSGLVTQMVVGRRAVVGVFTVLSMNVPGLQGIPGAYTRVTSFLTWINSVIGGGGNEGTTTTTTTLNTTTMPPFPPPSSTPSTPSWTVPTTPRTTTTTRSNASKSFGFSMIVLFLSSFLVFGVK